MTASVGYENVEKHLALLTAEHEQATMVALDRLRSVLHFNLDLEKMKQ